MDCITTHRAVIFDRGGTRRIRAIDDLSYVSWERTRDGVSTAEIRLVGDSCSSQNEFLATLSTHRHELVIFRGTTINRRRMWDRVWEGPLHRIKLEEDSATLVAHDPFEYLNFTPLTRAWNNNGAAATTVTNRVEQIVQYELTHSRQQRAISGGMVTVPAWESLDPPINVLPHMVVHHFPNEARTAMATKPFEMSVGQHIRSLARQSGIDFTMLGRSLHVWDVSRSIGVLPQLSSENFLDRVVVTEYGADHAQASYVIGMDGVYGSALNPENMDFYGPWTTIYTSYNEEGSKSPTQVELNSQASRNLSGRSPAPIEVRIPDNSSIILSDSLQISDLVPGAAVPLAATLNSRQIAQRQKIDHVRVIETPDNGESIQVTLTPASRADSDVVEEQ